mgnify:CR=1 FL=1
MRSFLTSTLMIAALALGGSVHAQEASEGTGEFDVGRSLEPAVGEPYERETVGDWSVRCVRAGEGEAERCTLYQLLQNDEGVSVAEFNLFRLPEGGEIAAGTTIVVPLETFLPEQLTIAVDGENARRYPYRFCNRAGCIARVGLTSEQVDLLKQGANATLRIVPAAAPDTEVVLNLSLDGFTAGFDAIAPVAPQE